MPRRRSRAEAAQRLKRREGAYRFVLLRLHLLTQGTPLCQRERLFLARQHGDSSASAGLVGALASPYSQRCLVAWRLEQDSNRELLYRFNRPWSDGTTGIKLSPLELLEKLAALVPLPRVHLVRYGGCLAPHSTLRAAIIPTPRQQGVDGEDTKTGTPSWHWARLLGRVFDLDTATCSFCRRGPLRIIAAMTQESVITRILRHLKLASVPPPIAPARCRQAIRAFDDAHASVGS
jgi:hypothetical protein